MTDADTSRADPPVPVRDKTVQTAKIVDSVESQVKKTLQIIRTCSPSANRQILRFLFPNRSKSLKTTPRRLIILPGGIVKSH